MYKSDKLDKLSAFLYIQGPPSAPIWDRGQVGCAFALSIHYWSQYTNACLKIAS